AWQQHMTTLNNDYLCGDLSLQPRMQSPCLKSLTPPHDDSFTLISSKKNIVWKLMFVFSAGQPGRLSRGTFVRRSGRRIRTSYTDDQLTKLEEVFSKQRYMTGTEKMLLASALRLTQIQVKVWFQNRRTRATLTVKHRARRRKS
uniref:Homeobox domain-containing protein n=1 Tax=Oncorhynchus kisutch TaxID=8019 RepID=A0A8C7HB19_ONCKI